MTASVPLPTTVRERPVAWEVVRKGGYTRECGEGDVRFATVERNEAGLFMVVFHDSRVRTACMELGDWDGSGPLQGPVFRSRRSALDVARRAVTLTLELFWAREDAEDETRRRHGVGDG